MSAVYYLVRYNIGRTIKEGKIFLLSCKKRAKEVHYFMGPVVSWEPTVVILGSQEVPGRMPSTLQA